MRVYLSGGMEYAEHEGIHWRKEMQDWFEQKLEYSVFNPNVESKRFFDSEHPGVDFRAMKENDLDRYQIIARRLVEIDCEEIARRSDIVVCFWDEGAARGAGTKGELTMARYFGKPVYMVTSHPLQSLPGWVLGCVTRIFPTFEDLKSFLSAK
ncbi:MAG TPA: hypothetical protein VLY03_06890 [Bacteroidota bacterium]|nr:hypothetical protein [Bacteroidota bacterium]